MTIVVRKDLYQTHRPIDLSISPTGLLRIKQREGLRLQAYELGDGKRTIGYGHTGGVKPGEEITEAEATHLLQRDCDLAKVAIVHNVQQQLKQREFDALTSFIFNIGPVAFERSTVCKKIALGDMEAAAIAMLAWNKVNGEFWSGLYRRRKDEAAQFLGTTPEKVQQLNAFAR